MFNCRFTSAYCPRSSRTGDPQSLAARDDPLLVLQLRIEHAQRIRLNPPLVVRPQLVFHLQQFRAQQLHILWPAVAIPDRIDLQLHALEAEPREKRHHHLDHFRVHRCVFPDIFRGSWFGGTISSTSAPI